MRVKGGARSPRSHRWRLPHRHGHTLECRYDASTPAYLDHLMDHKVAYNVRSSLMNLTTVSVSPSA